MSTREKPSWPWTQLWPWMIGIVAVVVLLLPWSVMQVGQCVDYAPGLGESYCESGPIIGAPSAIVVAVISGLLILYFLLRIVRILLQRLRIRRGTETPRS
jgi:hypothetical protein